MNEEELLESFLKLSAEACEGWLQERQPDLNLKIVEAGKLKAEKLGYGDDLTGALEVLDRTTLVAERLDNPLAEALVWRGRANVLQVHERYNESLAASRRATQIYEKHGAPYDVAVARTVEVTVLGALERFDEAIELALWIRPFFEQTGYLIGQARLAGSLAQVYTWAWRLAEALPEYKRARTLYIDLDMKLDAARVLHNMGSLANRMDRFDLAASYYTRAYSDFEMGGDLVMMVKTQFNLARICRRRGQFEKALTHLLEARQLLNRVPHLPDGGYIDLFEAQVRRQLHQPDWAEKLLRQALWRFSGLKRQLEAAETLVELGHLLAARSRPESLAEALSCFEQAGSRLQRLNVPLFAAWVQLEQAELLYRLDRKVEAALRAQIAQDIFINVGLKMRLAQASVLLADCWTNGHPEKAKELYHECLLTAGEDDNLLAIRGWLGLGRLAQATEDAAAAEAAFVKAVTLLESMRHSLRHHSFRAGFLEDKQATMEGVLATVQSQPGRENQVLIWVERFKASALADLLVGQPPDASTNHVLRNLLQLREQLATTVDQRLSELYTNSSVALAKNKQRGPAIAAHDAHQTKGLSSIQRQLQSIDEQIARQHDPTHAWREGIAITPSQVHDLLNEKTALISYYAIDNQLYALTATHVPGNLEIYKLQVNLNEIERLWQQTKRLIVKPNIPIAIVQARLSSLWEALVAPIESCLTYKKRLLILPHRSLFHIPFAALYDRQRKQYLLERWSLQIAPSATIFAWCRQRPHPGQQALLVGYPGEPSQTGFLPGVEKELEALTGLIPNTTVLLGHDATVENILTHAPGKNLIHLAGHAFYNGRTPLESGMPLSNGRWLHASDLYLHHDHMNGATIILSGCETGRGKPTGNDILGLTSAFLYAGAVGIVAGLWRIDDIATTNLMTAYYRGLIQGMETADALRQAQLSLLFSAEYKAPYYWASFNLNGRSRAVFKRQL